MWNSFRTDSYDGMLAETISLTGYNGDQIRGYLSRPLTPGPHPSVVLIPHMPGWDEFCRETTRRFSQHGYIALCPDIFGRFGAGTPEDVAHIMQDAGGAPDDSVMGDCESALHYLQSMPVSNGKVGVIGMCSGGRHSFLAACRIPGFTAAVDCWGDKFAASGDQLTPAQPVAPLEYAPQLSCPLLGIFGNDDFLIPPEQVDLQEQTLEKYHKDYKIYRYEGAGHAFFSYDGGSYRPQQAMDAWEKIFAFFDKHLK